MASASAAAQKNMAIVCLMLLAVGLMVIGMTDATDTSNVNCTGTVTDARLPNHECICSKNCACAGKCILESPDTVQACFIDCVLKNDCICEEEKNSGAADK